MDETTLVDMARYAKHATDEMMKHRDTEQWTAYALIARNARDAVIDYILAHAESDRRGDEQ